MATVSENTDSQVLNLLRVGEATTVGTLAEATGVTDTAVRQRLNRLMGQGLVRRKTVKAGRGRPSHQYELTDKAIKSLGSNFSDLAMVLWREVRSIPDPEIRRGLIGRLAEGLADVYEPQIHGKSTRERMQSIAELFGQRDVDFEVREESGELPILRANACPYPELAEQDRGICAIERLMFAKLLEEDVRLSQCRLDGHTCCEFSTPTAEGN